MIKMEEEPQAVVHGGFVKVKCTDCSNEQVLFWRTNTVVNCQVCGGTLAEPTGGKADLKGEMVGVVE